MRTGSIATTTGLYRSDCSCVVLEKIGRGDDAPKCPKCRRVVGWSFVRSEYVPPPLEDPLGERAEGRGGSSGSDA
jgi:hypothetical protein